MMAARGFQPRALRSHQGPVHRSALARAPLPSCWSRRLARCAAMQQPVYQPGPPRTFTEFTVYTDQGALNAHPVLPTMVRARNGVDVSMKKAGGFMLTVAPAAMVYSGFTQGPRRYSWEQKIYFALSSFEMAEIKDWSPEGGTPLILQHSNRDGSKATFALRPDVSPGGALMVVERINPENSMAVTVQLTKGQLGVFKSLCEFLIPRLYAFDLLFEGDLNMEQPPMGASTGAAYYAPAPGQQTMTSQAY